MKKSVKYYIAVWLILLVMYNVVIFTLRAAMLKFATDSGARFWIAWAFVMAAFAGQLLCAVIAFRSENKEKMFLHIPLITESYLALALMTVTGCGLMLKPGCPSWLAAVVCVVILGFSAISVLQAKAAAELVSGTDQKIKTKTFFIKSLTADAESLLTRAGSEEIKTELTKVYDALRYSDPMSNDALTELESQIALQFDILKKAVGEGNRDAVMTEAEELTALIGERNRKCKLLK